MVINGQAIINGQAAINSGRVINGIEQGGSPPDAPTLLVATPVSVSQIDLAWTDNATNETGYKIYRSDNGGAYNLIDTIAADSVSYSDTTVTAGVAHYYKVAAYNGAGEAGSNAAGTNTLLWVPEGHYWKLEEASGNRVDSWGSLSATPSGTVGQGAGKIGNAATFSSGALASTLANINMGSGATMWAWIKLSVSAVPQRGIVTDGTTAGDGIVYNGSNQWRIVIIDTVSGVSSATDTFAPTLGNWHFVCGRYNPSTKKGEIRVDNRAWVVSGTPLTNGAGLITTLVFGTWGATLASDYSQDETGVVTRYYTDAEVDALYNAGSGVQYPFY